MKYLLKIFYYLLFLSLLLASTSAIALKQNAKAWLAVNTQHPFNEDKKWLYSLYSQARLINESHPWQTILFEGAVGFQLVADKSIWLGYRWSGHPRTSFYYTNRLFQQLNWQIRKDDCIHITSRSRLEESRRSHQHQTQLRFRERLALELQYFLLNKINPYFYDEVFLQLNKTDYTAHQLISQNRLFIGINYYPEERASRRTKEKWWEMGYINQFQYKTPQSNQNQMSHIISLTYNF